MTALAIPRAVQLVVDDVGWREGWWTDADGKDADRQSPDNPAWRDWHVMARLN